MISYNILRGDCHEILARLSTDPKERAKYRVVVTSPPYYGHRHYGRDAHEIGQEENEEIFIKKLADIFMICKDLLTDDGSLWIVIGDTRRKYRKLLIPHRLALKLVEMGYTVREDIIWFKKNNVSSSSKDNFSQAYEVILFLSKNEKSLANMSSIRVRGNEAREGRNKTPPPHLIQYEPINQDRNRIEEINEIIRNAKPYTSFDELPTTSEISRAYGFDPEKYCPTCYRKFKRHATRKRIGDHRHYPIFAVCNSVGKNPGNVWEVATKAHYGSEHFAIFPEDLIDIIINFTTQEGDWVLDPFVGRGTSGMVSEYRHRRFRGIDLYAENVSRAIENIRSVKEGKITLNLANQRGHWYLDF